VLGRIGGAWGVVGVAALLLEADWRLAVHAWSAVKSDLSALQWIVLVGWVGVMTYAEGWRGFHLRFSTRVVARAEVIARAPRIVDVLLAPLFCMSFYGASPRGVRAAWILVVGIATLVMLVRLLPAPWRGIVDAGVVAGLTTGLASLGYHAVRSLLGHRAAVDPDAPGRSPRSVDEPP
jgi:hypothetical protein